MTRRRADGGPRTSRLTVQGWFYVVLAFMVVFVAVGTVVGAQLLQRTTDVTDRLVDRIQPARAEAYRMQTAILDQETGARGFALTGDAAFAEPYIAGQETEADAAAEIRRLLPEYGDVIADLDQIQELVAAWRRDYAEPTIASVRADGPRSFDQTTSQEAKAAFDEVRALFDEQNRHLLAVRSASEAELADANAQRNQVFALLIGGFFLAGAVMTLLLRTLVTRPLDVLRSSSQRIAEGDFSHPIAQSGPSDIRAVARDVELMRHRMVVALDASREQERLLQAQTADLDAQAFELRRSNAELEQFAYVASHDLQEPLRKVASFCQLLEKRYGDELDERGRQYIDFAVDGAKRMQVLITDLLTFSRVGRVDEQTEEVALDATLDEALSSISTALEETHARVDRPTELPVLQGDPTLLTMLWQNLVGNAVKFRAPDRDPVVTITCEPDQQREAGESWLLSVTDNGIGIPPEFSEKVFVIFQRLHSREAYAGTGIGLSLCKKIVDHHGGRIWIDTDYVGGTRICFTLSARAGTARAVLEAGANDLANPATTTAATAAASTTSTTSTTSEGIHA